MPSGLSALAGPGALLFGLGVLGFPLVFAFFAVEPGVNRGARDNVGASAPVADLRGRDSARCDPVVNRGDGPLNFGSKLHDCEVVLGGSWVTHGGKVTPLAKLRQEARQKILKNFADALGVSATTAIYTQVLDEAAAAAVVAIPGAE